MTHATIELLNLSEGDEVTFKRTATGLEVSATRTLPGSVTVMTRTRHFTRDQLVAPYGGFDCLGQVLGELREVLDRVSAPESVA